MNKTEKKQQFTLRSIAEELTEAKEARHVRPNAGEDQLTRWKKCRIRHLRRDERGRRHAGRSSVMLVLHRMILVPELQL